MLIFYPKITKPMASHVDHIMVCLDGLLRADMALLFNSIVLVEGDSLLFVLKVVSLLKSFLWNILEILEDPVMEVSYIGPKQRR